MTRLPDDQIATQASPEPIELVELRALLQEAAGRLHLALGQLTPAWRNLANGTPGYRGTTDEELHFTHPESYATILDDPAVIALDQLRTAANALARHASTAYGVATTWATGDTPPATPVSHDIDLWCESCLRIGKCSPRYRGVLCRFCYDFNATEHQRPPEKLVRLKHEGVRITAAEVDKALGRKSKKRRS